MSKIVLDKKFVCTDSQYGTQGHNKWWSVKVYDDGTLETEYGRVGDPGASTTKSFGSEEKALREAEKLIRKKEKGKAKKDGSGGRDSQYKEVEIVGSVSPGTSNRSLGKEAWKKIANGDSKVESLISLLDQENVHNITSQTTLTYDEDTGLFSTPLGVVGQTSIDEARNLLSKMRPFVEKQKFKDKKGNKLAEEFMMLIPQNVGRKRPTLETLCRTVGELENHNSILDSLQASLDMILTPKDDDPKIEVPDFGVVVGLLDDNKEFDRLDKFFKMTKRSQHVCHHLKMQKVYTVKHNEMIEAFEKKGRKIGNIMELWHGTRVGNILSILAKGMNIPPASSAHCTGRMFGNGVYFSDQSTKSLNYSYGYWSGSRNEHCFMFLFDVAMGKPYTPSGRYYYRSNYPAKGYDSTYAKAGESGVQNNEMIVYKVHQCCPKYLIEFE